MALKVLQVLFIIIIASSLSFSQVNLENGLVGWYSFDQIEDTIVVNQSTAVNKAPDGIIALDLGSNEPPVLSEGISGNAFAFTPTSTAHVNLGVYDPSAETNELAISCWIYWGGADGNWHGIAGLRDGWEPPLIGWSMVTDATSGGLQFETNTSTYGKVSIITEPPAVNQWVHVVLNFDSAYATYYFDTLQVAYGEMLFGEGRSTATFNIGAGSKGGGAAFNGTIDEFMIFNRMLTKDEIKFLYENPGKITAISDRVDANLPEQYTITNYPNPFNPSTRIEYQLMKSSDVTLKVVNALGQTVRALVDHEFQNAGRHQAIWDGMNSFGQSMASGVYFVVMTTEEVVKSKKILLLR